MLDEFILKILKTFEIESVWEVHVKISEIVEIESVEVTSCEIFWKT